MIKESALSNHRLLKRVGLERFFMTVDQKQNSLARHFPKNEASAGISHLSLASIPSILRECAVLKCLRLGSSIHAVVVKMGLESYTPIANSTMSFYMKCGQMHPASSVFDCIEQKDSISWNVLIHGLLQQGAFEDGLMAFVHGRAFNFEINASTLVLTLQACWKMSYVREGHLLHGFMIRGGLCAELPVLNSLLYMYTRQYDVESAATLFDEMSLRDAASWSSMISLYAHVGNYMAAFGEYRKALMEVECIDEVTMVNVLQACSGMGDVKYGRFIHGQVISRGLLTDVFIGNSLIDMYSKCLDIDSGFLVHNRMIQRNIITWNSMLSGLVLNERYWEVITFHASMTSEGLFADEVTMVNLLQASKNLKNHRWCKCIHAVVIRGLFGSNLLVMNTLLDAYAKCGNVILSAKLFELIETRDLVSWSTMIGGYAHCGLPDEAFSLFREMLLSRQKPNVAVVLNLLEACSLSAEILRVKSAHGLAIRNFLIDEPEVSTAILDTYAKFGLIDHSRMVFDGMPIKNIVSWSAMIRSYGMNGCATEALSLFHEIQSSKVKTNLVTVLAILSACSHGGLVFEGLSCFNEMLTDPLFYPHQEHYSCMVDMVARSGDIKSAIEIVERLPKTAKSNKNAWAALLSACRSYGNCDLGMAVASRAIEMEPFSTSNYLLAFKIFVMGGHSREDATKFRLEMEERSLKIVSGYSLIHVGSRGYRFLASDGSHPLTGELYSMLRCLHKQMESHRN